MKRFFVCFVVLAAMVVMIGCGGTDDNNSSHNSSGVCYYGEYKCSGNMLMKCDIDETWKNFEQCDAADKTCNAQTGRCENKEYEDNSDSAASSENNNDNSSECTYGKFKCVGNESHYCNSNGSWVYDSRCEYGCDSSTGKCKKNSGDNNEGGNNEGENNEGGNNEGGDNEGENNEGGDGNCAEGLFYYQGECQTPWGKMWTVTFEEAQVSEKKADGTAWDIPGGLPDLFACLYINNVKKFCTSVVDDATKAVWNYSKTVEFAAKTDTIEYCLFDEDLSEHDNVGCAVHEFDWFTFEDGVTASGGVVESFRFSLKPAW